MNCRANILCVSILAVFIGRVAQRASLKLKMNKRKQQENEIGENDLVSYLEDKMGHLKPYWTQITLGICLVVLAMMAAFYLFEQGKKNEAGKWQALNDARLQYRNTGDNTMLIDFADQFPNDSAGLWALLFAADAEVRSGLAEFSSDRESGYSKITKGQGFYKRIIDSKTAKSTLLQRGSVYGLAYAHESNGEFEQAAALYEQLVEENPLAEDAKRGLARSTSQEFVTVYNVFRDFDAGDGTAPGLKLPRRPDITFPELGAQPNSGGGEFAAIGDDSSAVAEPTGDAPGSGSN